MAGPWAKTFSSSLCIVPPRSAWARIQETRVFHDKSFTRWPPHVNLLYPFLASEHFPEAAQLCRDALATIPSFEVTLRELQWFEHGRSCTLWVRPEADELQSVQAALVRAFPQCTDLSDDPSRGITSFTPHLSLGQWRSQADVSAAAAAHQAGAWQQPLAFSAGGVVLMSRAGFDAPFTVQWFCPFGGGQPVQMEVPYIATVGDASATALESAPAGLAVAATAGAAGRTTATSSSTASAAGAAAPAAEPAPEPALALPAAAASPAARASAPPAPTPVAPSDFGLGSSQPDGSVWMFSFGANMSPTKLSSVRSIQPLQSLPASLPGWRLSFTHRGGMGNLRQMASGGDEEAPPGLPGVHGVLHRLSAADYGRLINMEHEYRPVEVEVFPYGASHPLPAVACVTPDHMCTVEGLPPIQRYLSLLQEGADHWKLEPRYRQWLAGLQGVDSRQRGEEYYTTAAGEPLPGLPKIRTGSQPRQQQGRGRGRRGQQQQQGGDGGRGTGRRQREQLAGKQR